MRRHFPRASLAAALSGVLLCAAAVPVLSGVSASAADLGDRKAKVDKTIDKKAQQLDESSAQLAAATAALQQAQADLARAQAYLAQTEGELAAARALDEQMQQRLEAAVARLRAARRDLEAGRADVAAQEDELRSMVVSTYQQGDPSLLGLSMVFTTQDPAQIAGSLNASSTVVDAQSAVLDHFEASKVMLAVKRTEMRAAKDDVAEKRAAAAKNLRTKQALEEQARNAASQVATMVSLRAEARDTAVKAKNSDLAALAKLQAERDRIAALIAAQVVTGGTYTGPVNGNGFLDVPVNGRITSPFGWRIHPIWGYRSLHDGIDFGAACGTPILAPASGTVLSEYYQTAWGNRIIINHGQKFGVNVSTISNHLSGYAVAEGAHVDRGDVVGYVGTTGWSTGCHLHFTVLQNGTPVDPLTWF